MGEQWLRAPLTSCRFASDSVTNHQTCTCTFTCTGRDLVPVQPEQIYAGTDVSHFGHQRPVPLESPVDRAAERGAGAGQVLHLERLVAALEPDFVGDRVGGGIGGIGALIGGDFGAGFELEAG